MVNDVDETQRVGGRLDHLRLVASLPGDGLCRAFLVEDTVGGRRLCAKVLPRPLSRVEEQMDWLRKALVPAAHLDHPVLVRLRHLHDVWDVDDQAQEHGFVRGMRLILSDYVPGTPVRDWAVPGDQRGLSVWAPIFEPLAGALDYAHQQNISHGYLAPSSLFITEQSQPRVTDLAAAALIRLAMVRAGLLDKDDRDDEPWIAPEVKAGVLPAPRADVFSYGMLLSAALSGTWDGPLAEDQQGSELNDEQRETLSACRAGEPEQRPATCSAAWKRLVEAGSEVSGAGVAVAAASNRGDVDAAAGADGGSAPDAGAGSGPMGVGHSGEAHLASHAPVAVSPRRDQPEPWRSSARAASPAPEDGTATVRKPWFDGQRMNLCIGAAVLTLAILLTALAWRYGGAGKEERGPESAWSTVEEQTRFAREFASTATLTRAGPDLSMRLRLIGQTTRLDIGVQGDQVVASQSRGPGDEKELMRAPLGAPCAVGDRLAVIKSPDGVALYHNGVRQAALPWPMERVARALWQVPESDPSPATFRLQKIGPLVFSDDFMHGENEFGAWTPTSGRWTVHALQNPIRSANPFSFLGQGEDALAVAGQWFWRDYSVSAAVHPLPGSAFGLAFCWNDPGNTYELVWSSSDQERTALSLERLAGGKRTTLGGVQLPFVPQRWYRLEASHAGGRITVRVDGHDVLQVQDAAPLLGGAIGFISRGGEGTVFDDCTVTPFEEAVFDFGRQSARRDALLRVMDAGSGPESGLQRIDVLGILLENACVSSTLLGVDGVEDGPAVALVARRTGAGEVTCTLEKIVDTWRVVMSARLPGQSLVLAEQAVPRPGPETQISLHVLDDEGWVIVDGAMVCHVADLPVQEQGLCGVRIAADAGVSQRVLRVRPQRALPEVANRVETFTHEQSMQNWSSAVLEWNVEYAGERPAYWHRSDFWQDLAADMAVQTLFDVNNPMVWGLALRNPGAAERDQDSSAVALLFDPALREIQLSGLVGDDRRLKLMRQQVDTLGLERRSGRLLARLNGDVVWNEPLPDRLRGLCQVGRYGRGNTEPWANAVVLRADGVETYSFKRAPSAWLPATGIWEVTNRWQCDARWSFYSGVQRGGVACNWNKFEHGDNVTIEFFAGPKMDQERGRKYEYAGDLNAVICADGRDVTSGYSFMFGGWNDRGSQIVRGEEIIGENRKVVIPRETSTHRRWFHVKLRKSGERLSFWVDGTLVASKVDPKPLEGNRFGLWTWDNGMMVAQVRVSSDEPLQAVPLTKDRLPVPRTPYNPGK